MLFLFYFSVGLAQNLDVLQSIKFFLGELITFAFDLVYLGGVILVLEFGSLVLISNCCDLGLDVIDVRLHLIDFLLLLVI